ncbi:hypothetical protein AGRO_5105 [Agrobacterium sp. ATCC 31749]|nr:hypothetical protein AGRO_5105 [Agrobacterium sp. ATCC 31749]
MCLISHICSWWVAGLIGRLRSMERVWRIAASPTIAAIVSI